MPVYLSKEVLSSLPAEAEINASLLATKYSFIKTKAESESAKEHAERVCSGRGEMPKFSYTKIPGSLYALMRLQGRMMVNQSGGVVENANLSLHHNFGFPYIPGSAVKGCTRHHVWTLWDGARSDQPQAAVGYARDIISIFGYPTGDESLDQWCEKELPEEAISPRTGKRSALEGRVVFFAAQPEDKAVLEPEVLTVHHKDYYTDSEKHTARDDEAPVPVFFPAVKAGAFFEFVVRPLTSADSESACKAMEYLQSAMEIEGAGSKTAAGYGWFERDEARTRRVKEREVLEQQREAERAEQERQRAADAEALKAKRATQEKLSTMTDEERADFIVSEWNDGKWSAVLGSDTEFKKLDAMTANAVVRALATSSADKWNALKDKAQSGKKKEKERAAPVVQLIYPLAKNHNPRIKMP